MLLEYRKNAKDNHGKEDKQPVATKMKRQEIILKTIFTLLFISSCLCKLGTSLKSILHLIFRQNTLHFSNLNG